LASTSLARAAAAEPAVRARPRQRRRSRTQARARVGVVWIVVSGILLTGVVFVSVSVLRLNLALDHANGQRTQLRSDIASLQAQLATELASPRIQATARKELGVKPADPSEIGYVDLAK
jgi:cell division protein FtsL